MALRQEIDQLKEVNHSSIPAWTGICFSSAVGGVLQARSQESLGRVASLVGIPLHMDVPTMEWALIELNTSRPLPKTVWVQNEDVMFEQEVV